MDIKIKFLNNIVLRTKETTYNIKQIFFKGSINVKMDLGLSMDTSQPKIPPLFKEVNIRLNNLVVDLWFMITFLKMMTDCM